MTENEVKILNGEQFLNADSLYSPVEKTAELFPNNTALRFMGKNITYKTLKNKVKHYVDSFKAAGAVKGEVITFALPNIPESIYILYASAKAGLKSAPLHPLSPPVAISTAMTATKSRFVFVLPNMAQSVAELQKDAAVIAVNPVNSLKLRGKIYLLKQPLPKQKDNLFRFETFVKNPACIKPVSAPLKCPAGDNSNILLQSGGTSGSPKTVGLSYKAVNNLAKKGLWILSKDKVTDCGMMSALPLFHGFGLAMGVHSMLCHGGKNVLFAKFRRSEAVKEIRKGNINFLIGIPRLYEAILSHPKFRGKKLNKQFIAFVGGDFVPPRLMENFDRTVKKSGGKCRLFEGYGLTETVNVCAVNTYENNKQGTVGKPLTGVGIAAFDFSDTPKKLGADECGELAVCGDTLMTEYVGDTAATDSVFFEYEGKKYIKTGDFGSVDSEGFVKFVSRIKRVIKVRGVPVYPSEIERFSCMNGNITDACAIPVSHGSEQRLVLFVTGKTEPDLLELRRSIRENMSVYSEPHEIYYVKEFPYTSAGKTDTAKLTEKYTK